MTAPLASMTGAGAAALDLDVGRFEAEARSVNHRFLKTSLRTSGPVPVLDAVVEEAVRARLTRGHVTVFVRFTPSSQAAGGGIDEQAFAAGARRLAALAAAHGVASVTVSDVLRLPGVLSDPRPDADADALAAAAATAVGTALDQLLASRRREGEALGAEIHRLLDEIGQALVQVRAGADEVPRAAKARLEARLAELLAGSVALDPAQVAREAALLADRADVREEIARLEAHLAHGREMLDEGGAVGRNLDFLVQELHRETNTIGSKSSDLALSRTVLAMKSHVERLREQVQNLE